MRKKKKFILGIGVPAAVVVVLLILLLAYTNGDSYKYNKEHLAAGTIINGVDCSDMSLKDAEDALTSKWQKEKFIVKENGNDVARFSLSKTHYDIKDKLENINGTNPFAIIKNHMGSGEKEHKIAMKMADNDAFDKTVKKDKFLDIPYETKTKDAYVDTEDTSFKIVKEVYGDNVDKDMVLTAIKDNISDEKFELNFDKNDFIDVPDVKEGDEVLKEEQEFDKEHYSLKIVYEKFNGTYQIKPADLKKMRPVDENGKASVDKKAIEKYMNDVLAWEVNTRYFDRQFKSTDQGEITLNGGTLGYELDKKKEAKQLAKNLEAGKDVDREPIFSAKPYYTGKGESDIGDDYIEVSIASQTLWLYKNGKKVMTSAVTTGQSGHDTQKGAFFIQYMERNATLRGQDYESPVSYWMPFNGNQGCHDATWRSNFGSGSYVSNGSHGCVNMPYSAAAQLYSEVEKNFPVIVH